MSSLKWICVAVVTFVTSAAEADADRYTEVLADFVAKQDESYEWRVQSRYERHGTEILELRLHSQTWRDTLWKHQLYIIQPRKVRIGSQALMVIAGGRWRDEYDSEQSAFLPDDVDVFLKIAKRLQTTVAVIAQVPYQPLFDRTEDEIIAYTFDQFLQSGDAEWPLLLPMVKSVVRAMDAVQAATRQEWDLTVDQFTVVGGSKRGWTTWLVAAVDKRVAAIMPIVIDALNMVLHFPYQSEVWGEPSPEIRPYTDLDLHVVLASDEGRALREIVDPFSYRAVLDQPKMIVVATNDSFFPVDALNLYWRELLGSKFILYLPNNGHSTDDLRRILRNLNAIHRFAASEIEMPKLDWEFQQDTKALALSIHSQPQPRRVRIWSANSDTRDFREAEWSSTRLRRKGDTYWVELPRPAQGHQAVFAEASFGRGRDTFSLATNLCVMSAPEEMFDTPGIRFQEAICGRVEH